jgi:hypothetical protein
MASEQASNCWANIAWSGAWAWASSCAKLGSKSEARARPAGALPTPSGSGPGSAARPSAVPATTPCARPGHRSGRCPVLRARSAIAGPRRRHRVAAPAAGAPQTPRAVPSSPVAAANRARPSTARRRPAASAAPPSPSRRANTIPRRQRVGPKALAVELAIGKGGTYHHPVRVRQRGALNASPVRGKHDRRALLALQRAARPPCLGNVWWQLARTVMRGTNREVISQTVLSQHIGPDLLRPCVGVHAFLRRWMVRQAAAPVGLHAFFRRIVAV